MSFGFRRSVGAVLIAAALASGVAVAGAASGRSNVSCDARSGTTTLEDAVARVFKSHGHLYACSRTTGAIREVILTRVGLNGRASTPARQVDLAGQSVAFTALDLNAPRPIMTLNVIDAATGKMETVSSVSTPAGSATSYAAGAYVLADNGTVVWIVNHTSCYDPTEHCSVESTVSEEGPSGRSTLARVSDAGTTTPPITELGLSADGTVAYWIANGTYAGAKIS